MRPTRGFINSCSIPSGAAAVAAAAAAPLPPPTAEADVTRVGAAEECLLGGGAERVCNNKPCRSLLHDKGKSANMSARSIAVGLNTLYGRYRVHNLGTKLEGLEWAEHQ